MKKRKYIVKEKVWLWPGVGGWHFITLPKTLFVEIRKNFGLGMVPIMARIGKTSWKTALFPHKQSGAYLISIKKNVRKEEDIFEGDIVSVNFEII